MFQSATLKLTAWYAGVIIAVSILFSVLIFSIATHEVGSRLDAYTSDLPIAKYESIQYLRDTQEHKAEHNLLTTLFATNVLIWLVAIIGSYYLAKRTLRPIEEAHEAQSRFTSDASHELLTPLASMKVELEVALRDSDLTKPAMRELLASNLEEVNKLTNLSQMLLQLSRLDHDNILREKVALNATVSAVVNGFKQPARLKLTLPSRPLYAIANKTNVEELLTILIDNALKYSPKNSEVTVTAVKRDDMVGFEITNGGQGIPADALPNIFDRFYRVDSSRTGGKKKGYGLGLALAKKIVELHNGDLTVSSEPGTTTFCFLLPILSNNQAELQS